MVVDDLDVMRDVLTRVLQREGYETLSAASGEEAMNLLAQSHHPGHAPPDLILLDIKMPDIDGLELLERLHDDPMWQKTPVIMLTAQSDTHSVHRAQQLGAKAYLVKAAFSVAEMLRHVKTYTQYLPH